MLSGVTEQTEKTYTEDRDDGRGPVATLAGRRYDPAHDGSLVVTGPGRHRRVASLVSQLRESGADVSIVEASRPPGRYLTPVQEAEASLRQARTRHRRHVVVIDGYDLMPATATVLHALVLGATSTDRQDTLTVVLPVQETTCSSVRSVLGSCTVIEAGADPRDDCWRGPTSAPGGAS